MSIASGIAFSACALLTNHGPIGAKNCAPRHQLGLLQRSASRPAPDRRRSNVALTITFRYTALAARDGRRARRRFRPTDGPASADCGRWEAHP